MAGFDYARSRAAAERLIARFGTSGAIRRSVNAGPSYDPEVTDTDYPCRLVVLEYSDTNIDGTLIRGTDKQIYISTADVAITLTKSDKVIVDGEEYGIERLKPLRPGGLVVYWEVQGRR